MRRSKVRPVATNLEGNTKRYEDKVVDWTNGVF